MLILSFNCLIITSHFSWSLQWNQNVLKMAPLPHSMSFLNDVTMPSARSVCKHKHVFNYKLLKVKVGVLAQLACKMEDDAELLSKLNIMIIRNNTPSVSNKLNCWKCMLICCKPVHQMIKAISMHSSLIERSFWFTQHFADVYTILETVCTVV